MKPLLAHLASVSVLAAILLLAPALPVHAQADSANTASASRRTQNSAPENESSKSLPTRKQTAAAPHHKKKKTSFVHKMRDKALAKVQKLFGSKQALKEDLKQE